MSLIRKNLIANFAGKAWLGVMSLIFVPIYIKFIGIESYGMVGIWASLTSIFSLLDLGLSTVLNKELSTYSAKGFSDANECRSLVRTLELLYWGIALIIGALLAWGAPLIAHHWLNLDQLSPQSAQRSIIYLGIAIAFQWPTALYTGGLMGLQRQVLFNTTNAVFATIRGLGAIVVLWFISPTIEVFFIWQMIVSLLLTIVMGRSLWRSLPKAEERPKFDAAILKRISRFAGGLSSVAVLSVILMNLDKVILSKMLSLELFGYYSLAVVVANGLYFLATPIFTTYFPRLSQLVSLGDEEELKRLYHQSCQLMSVLITPVAVVLIFFSREILQAWTGNAITVENTYLQVSLLMIGTLCNGLMHMPYALQLAHEWTKLAFYQNIIAVILLVPVLYFGIVYFGVVGATLGWIFINLGYVLIGIHIMHRKLLRGEKQQWYFLDVGLPLLGTLTSVCTARFFFPEEAGRLLTIVFIGIILVITFCISYLMIPQSIPFRKKCLQYFFAR